jgi:hypothetical protein
LELPQLWRGGSCVCCELGIQIRDVGLKSGDFLGVSGLNGAPWV